MSQQIVVTFRVSPHNHSEAGFETVKTWFIYKVECPYGEITDVHVDVDDGAPRE